MLIALVIYLCVGALIIVIARQTGTARPLGRLIWLPFWPLLLPMLGAPSRPRPLHWPPLPTDDRAYGKAIAETIGRLRCAVAQVDVELASLLADRTPQFVQLAQELLQQREKLLRLDASLAPYGEPAGQNENLLRLRAIRRQVAATITRTLDHTDRVTTQLLVLSFAPPSDSAALDDVSLLIDALVALRFETEPPTPTLGGADLDDADQPTSGAADLIETANLVRINAERE